MTNEQPDQTEDPADEVLNTIFREAVVHRASEILIGPEDDVLQVKFRIGGARQEFMELPADIHAALLQRLKQLAVPGADQRDGGTIAFQMADGLVHHLQFQAIPGPEGEKAILAFEDEPQEPAEAPTK
ncbi:MAG: hypothetical protein M3Y56_16210 [Armatimonadota bacterium]|nr:hypothetical protein [Armatimonadota bacterium]